jgi:hypothetical protein
LITLTFGDFHLFPPLLSLFLYRSMKGYLTAAGTFDLVQQDLGPSARNGSGEASYPAQVVPIDEELIDLDLIASLVTGHSHHLLS